MKKKFQTTLRVVVELVETKLVDEVVAIVSVGVVSSARSSNCLWTRASRVAEVELNFCVTKLDDKVSCF